MESADMQLVMFALIATIPLVGAMMAITPLLQPNGQAFSVSVPEVAQSDPGIRVLKHRFVAIIAALTAILTLVAVVFCLMGSMKAVMALVVAGSLAPLVQATGLSCAIAAAFRRLSASAAGRLRRSNVLRRSGRVLRMRRGRFR